MELNMAKGNGQQELFPVSQGHPAASTSPQRPRRLRLRATFPASGPSAALTWTDAESGHIPQKEAFIIEVKEGKPTFVQRLAPSWTPEL